MKGDKNTIVYTNNDKTIHTCSYIVIKNSHDEYQKCIHCGNVKHILTKNT